MIEKKIQRKEETNVILAGWLKQGDSETVIKEYLDELAFLAETAGAKEVKRFYQRLPHPDSKTFLGSGKLEEIRQYIQSHQIDMVIFDEKADFVFDRVIALIKRI